MMRCAASLAFLVLQCFPTETSAATGYGARHRSVVSPTHGPTASPEEQDSEKITGFTLTDAEKVLLFNAEHAAGSEKVTLTSSGSMHRASSSKSRPQDLVAAGEEDHARQLAGEKAGDSLAKLAMHEDLHGDRLVFEDSEDSKAGEQAGEAGEAGEVRDGLEPGETVHHHSRVRAMFQDSDTDGDGKLSDDEVKAFMKGYLNRARLPEELQHKLSQMVYEPTGSMTYPVFKAGLHKFLLQLKAKKEMNKQKDKLGLDADEDGDEDYLHPEHHEAKKEKHHAAKKEKHHDGNSDEH